MIAQTSNSVIHSRFPQEKKKEGCTCGRSRCTTGSLSASPSSVWKAGDAVREAITSVPDRPRDADEGNFSVARERECT